MEESTEQYVVMSPRAVVPGSVCVVGTVSQQQKVIARQTAATTAIYTVRAVIADHVPLAGTLAAILTASPGCYITLNEDPLTIYLHHGYENAIFFDLRSAKENTLTHIDVEVETPAPLLAFPSARRAINELLDTLMRRVWIPLLIYRLDLLDPNGDCIAHEVIFPFTTQLALGPLGGLHQFPAFSAIESLAREGICATSPYYRLLCAYRLYEGIGPLRKWLRDAAQQFGVDAKLPKAVRVDPQLLEHMGFSEEARSGVKTGDDLQRVLTDMRNSVAHFLVDDAESSLPPLHLSDGMAYFMVSMGGAALLLYGVEAVKDLHAYFRDHLETHIHTGRLVLPLKERRERFRVVVAHVNEPATNAKPNPAEPAARSS